MIDVRSPSEYVAGHIVGAHRLPLFSDEERAVVGTIYKEDGRQLAIKKGLDIVGPKMSTIVEKAEGLGSSDMLVYCWRGGMRSGSVSWLLKQYGLTPLTLDGGYKSYRNAILDYYQQCLPLRVITGYTGSQKTVLLHKIASHGGQVVDLEGLAGHQGSRYGNIGAEDQPSTEHFQNLVFNAFRALDLNKPIYIEDESAHIGQVALSEPLHKMMGISDHVRIDIPRAERIDALVQDYGSLASDQLVSATQSIARKLGSENAKNAIAHINQGELKEAVDIILRYYDKRYGASMTRNEDLIKKQYTLTIAELDRLALELAKMTIDEV